MALRKIITLENETLRKVSKPVKFFDESLWELLDDMKETLIKSTGVGLAAVQVAVLKRVFVISVNNTYFEVINPTITNKEGTQRGPEGCLSIPGKQCSVTRPNKVTVEFFDRFGNPITLTATEFMARAICHEYDHLDGILYIDHTKGGKLEGQL